VCLIFVPFLYRNFISFWIHIVYVCISVYLAASLLTGNFICAYFGTSLILKHVFLKLLHLPYHGLGQLSMYSDGIRVKRSGFDSRQRHKIFLFSTMSRLALGPTQPPIQWAPRDISEGLRGSGVKVAIHLHLVPRSRMVQLYPHSLLFVRGIMFNLKIRRKFLSFYTIKLAVTISGLPCES
jgi:hypothetical protein